MNSGSDIACALPCIETLLQPLATGFGSAMSYEFSTHRAHRAGRKMQCDTRIAYRRLPKYNAGTVRGVMMVLAPLTHKFLSDDTT